jgi:hypothetical protein
LPVLDRLGGSYREAGLIVLAINVGDREPDYAAHIEESGYEHVWFGRDGKGEIARLYGVRSIPVTYLLDREGVIQYAHVGFGRGLAKRLADEITPLLE